MFARLTLVPVALLCLFASPAEAYVGPGLGAGTLAVIFGLIGSVFLALLAFVWYPFKRLYRKVTASRKPEKENDPAGKPE